MGDSYWWSRYESFSPGLHNLPHMGEVIAYYRKKRYRTQEDFAIAAGVVIRTVQEWETNIMTADMGRRIFLARMLKISPALLGLDWRQVVYENHQGEYTDPLTHMIELIEEDAFYAYEDILIMGHDYIHNGGSLHIAYRVDRRLQKLVKIVKSVRETDKESWLSLLCRYYQLSTRIKQQCVKDERLASDHAKKAIAIAVDLKDAELIAASLVHSACTHDQQGKLVEAQADIAEAMKYTDKIRNGSLKGNIYLESANINTPFALSDKTLQNQCRAWQDKAATMLYKGLIEPDESFFRFNLSAVHHEKAKSLLSWQKTATDRKLIQDKLVLAIEALPPELAVWKGYYYMTEARLYLADHDLEGSAQSAKIALKTARSMHSRMVEDEVRSLYEELDEKNTLNPYVRNLGVELGIF
jgi:transcriptional regulator with XRE-family HTH domain